MIRVYVVFVRWRCDNDWPEPLTCLYDFETQAEVDAFKLGLAVAFTNPTTSIAERWANVQCCKTEREAALYVEGFKEAASKV